MMSTSFEQNVETARKKATGPESHRFSLILAYIVAKALYMFWILFEIGLYTSVSLGRADTRKATFK